MRDTIIPEKGIFSLRPAPCWEEGLLIGNGTMGAILMGLPGKTEIPLAHEKVYAHNQPRPKIVELSEFRDELRQTLRDPASWNTTVVGDRIVELSNAQGCRRWYWNDSFMRAGTLVIDLPSMPQPAEGQYRRTLDYATALATEQWSAKEGTYTQRAFVSRADNVLAYELSAGAENPVSGRIRLDRGSTRPESPEPDKEVLLDFDDYLETFDIRTGGNWMAQRCGFRESSSGYETVLWLVPSTGSISANSSELVFEDCEKVLILLRIDYLEDFNQSRVEKTLKELQALGSEFDPMLERSMSQHGELFNRVELDLGGSKGRNVPAEVLYEATRGKAASAAAVEQAFYSGRYEVICSTGELPPNLQGVWMGNDIAPWAGDYTNDGNVQVAIANYLNGNMHELMLSFARMLESMLDDMRANAWTHWRCRGILMPIRSSPRHGLNLHYHYGVASPAWTAGAAWATGYLYDYVLYTGDDVFFRERALPLMKEVALFYEDYLVEDDLGKYEFNPSYSPELWRTKVNATMEIAAALEVLNNLIDGCTRLGIEQDSVKHWEALRERIPPYGIWHNDGSLMEWSYEDYQDAYPEKREWFAKHRHCSHFYPLWFGVAPEIAGDPDLRNAAEKAVEIKAEYLKNAHFMAFGLVQVGLAAASLCRGDLTEQMINQLVTGFYFPTFSSAHNSRNPHDHSLPGPDVFNADISGGLPSLVLESLVQSKVGELNVLAALPESWTSGSVRGLSARGQVTIEELSWSESEVNVRLRSPKAQELRVLVAGRLVQEHVSVHADRTWVTTIRRKTLS